MRFYEAGCDDATISFQRGRIIVDFSREAESIDVALVSALTEVESTGATVERIEPDPLVSLADIATRTHMTRAAMTNYAKGHRGHGFPAPVARITSESPLWNWDEVAHWLFRHGRIDAETVLAAFALRRVNALLGTDRAGLGQILAQDVDACRAQLGGEVA